MATGFKFLSPQQVAQAEAWRIELTGRPDDTPSADCFTEEGANFEDEFAEVGEADFQQDSDEDGSLIDLTTDGLGDGLGKHFISFSFVINPI